MEKHALTAAGAIRTPRTSGQISHVDLRATGEYFRKLVNFGNVQGILNPSARGNTLECTRIADEACAQTSGQVWASILWVSALYYFASPRSNVDTSHDVPRTN